MVVGSVNVNRDKRNARAFSKVAGTVILSAAKNLSARNVREAFAG
jgi:hypothetical protein